MLIIVVFIPCSVSSFMAKLPIVLSPSLNKTCYVMLCNTQRHFTAKMNTLIQRYTFIPI